MNVVYDISILGQASLSNISRTGIFRVVENIATEILSLSECKIIFRSNIKNYFYTKNYIENHEIYKNNVLINPTFLSLPAKKTSVSYSCQSKYIELNGLINKSDKKEICNRVKRKLYRNAQPIINYLSNDFSQFELNKADIYHSTFYNLPKGIKSRGKFLKFQTIYDMIPIIHPQYFASADNEMALRKTLELLSDDGNYLCISESCKNDLLTYSKTINSEKVFVTHLAASDLFYPCNSLEIIKGIKDKYNIPPDCRYILSVATIEPRKNLEGLIKSFAELLLSEKINDLYLVLTGTLGWEYKKLFKKINADKNIQDRIILTGFVDDNDLSPLYSGALAFIYPSFYEGFGLPPLEAMQCGTPVITSNTSSLPEVVGKAGIMIDPYDISGFSGAIHNVYKDETVYNTMKKKSLERAKLFSWRKTAKTTVMAYKTALMG